MRAFVVLCAVALAGAVPVAKEDGMNRFISAIRDCVETDTLLCLKVCEVL